jgi:hypothetical protein
MAVLYTFRAPSLGRHVHREFMRSAWLDVTPIIPATACHQRNYVERYSRYKLLIVAGNKVVVIHRSLGRYGGNRVVVKVCPEGCTKKHEVLKSHGHVLQAMEEMRIAALLCHFVHPMLKANEIFGSFHETAKVVNSLSGETLCIPVCGSTNCQLEFERSQIFLQVYKIVVVKFMVS